MATIKVVFRGSSSESGEGSLFYRMIHGRKMRQIRTGIFIMRDEWDEESGTIIIRCERAGRVDYLEMARRQLKEGVARFSQIISDFSRAARDFSVDDIATRFMAPDAASGFLAFARKQIDGLKQIGRKRCAEHYATALNSLVRFTGDIEFAFDDFSSALMQKYECYLKDHGLCLNSISFYMRNLRALYNQAVEQGLTEQRYPFKHVYTGIAKTVKRAVSLDAIKRLRAVDLGRDPMSELARDLFLFSFCTRGMAIIDIAFLKKSNLKNGILTYRRRKTGQVLYVRWEAQMQEIVDRHPTKESEFLFPMIDSSKPDYRKQFLNAYSKLLRRLKRIGHQLGLADALTFHRSRHAWASIARDNNVPLSVISQGMGHDSEKTTSIYLASLDTTIVDKANSDIMSLLDK